MSEDAADLSRLADIVVPPPVPWWPPAPGWWIVGAGLLATLAILALVSVRRYRRNAYRRAALAELAAIPAVDAAGAVAISAILKRAALVAYPRAEVAALTGDKWLAFLDRSAATRDFTDGPAAGLARAAYGGAPGQGGDALAAARRWVKHHRAEA